MSTFWHKISDLKPVCSIKMWKFTEKSYFSALSVTFLRLVCILKLEGLLQHMLSGKTQWRVMSTFWHKMSDLKPVCSIKKWKLTEKSYFPALSVTFLRLVCILKLEDLLQGYVKWKNTMTFNINSWHKMSGRGLVISNVYGDIDRKIIFLCPLRYIFEARVHFKVGRSPSRIC